METVEIDAHCPRCNHWQCFDLDVTGYDLTDDVRYARVTCDYCASIYQHTVTFPICVEEAELIHAGDISV